MSVVPDPVIFAEARLAEDERELTADPPQGLGYANLSARVHREIEGIRNILARYEDCLVRTEDPDYSQLTALDQVREYEDFVLPNLLARWSDHPDYDPVFRE